MMQPAFTEERRLEHDGQTEITLFDNAPNAIRREWCLIMDTTGEEPVYSSTLRVSESDLADFGEPTELPDAITQLLLKELQDNSERQIRIHLRHCNQGEYEGSCKYGDDEGCPALTEEMVNISGTREAADKKFTINLALTAYAREEELAPSEIRKLVNGADVAFEYGSFFRNKHGIFIQLPGSKEKISVSSDEAFTTELIPAIMKFRDIKLG